MRISAPEPTQAASWQRQFIASLLLIAATLICYQPALHNGFLNYDDDAYITNNPHVKAGLSWATVKWAFTSYDAANYHPLTWLSHALDCQLFGLNAEGHHEVSILLHGLCAALLFLFLLHATGFLWRNFFVAALFALHPVNVESVAWAAERKNVLSMLFFLLALLAYVWYARRPRVGRYLLVVLLFVLAVLSKPQVITFPFLILLLDFWPLGRARAGTSSSDGPTSSFGMLLLEKIPFALLSAASAVVTMKAQRAGGAVQTLTQYSPLLRFETAAIAYVRYLGKAFWPSRLVALYPHPTALYPAWKVIAALVVLLFITVVVIRARERRFLLVGWLWFLGTLVPMLGLVQVGSQEMADRYAYIPFIGLFVMVTWLVAECEARHVPSSVFAVAGVVILFMLGALTYRQVGYWHDTESFWRRTIALTENNYVAHDSLGEYLMERGRADEAAAQFEAALKIRPDDLPANLDLGAYEHGRGDLAGAIKHYQVVAIYAGDRGIRAKAFANLGSAYRSLRDLAEASRCFEQSLKTQPEHPIPMALIGLGLIAERNGDFGGAARNYSRAMAVEPTDVGYLLLAGALEELGEKDKAEAIRARVERLSSDFEGAERQVESLRK